MRGKEGIVTKMPLICDNTAIYEVEIDGDIYKAVSVGTQAVKDYLFVRKGHNIEIEGDICSSRIDVQNVKIDIMSICKKK